MNLSRINVFKISIGILLFSILILSCANTAYLQNITHTYADKFSIVQNNMDKIFNAIDTFYLKHECYPSSIDELITNDANIEKLMLSETIDPWGNRYSYSAIHYKNDFQLKSFGEDGKQGGDGNNVDILFENDKIDALCSVYGCCFGDHIYTQVRIVSSRKHYEIRYLSANIGSEFQIKVKNIHRKEVIQFINSLEKSDAFVIHDDEPSKDTGGFCFISLSNSNKHNSFWCKPSEYRDQRYLAIVNLFFNYYHKYIKIPELISRLKHIDLNDIESVIDEISMEIPGDLIYNSIEPALVYTILKSICQYDNDGLVNEILCFMNKLGPDIIEHIIGYLSYDVSILNYYSFKFILSFIEHVKAGPGNDDESFEWIITHHDDANNTYNSVKSMLLKLDLIKLIKIAVSENHSEFAKTIQNIINNICSIRTISEAFAILAKYDYYIIDDIINNYELPQFVLIIESIRDSEDDGKWDYLIKIINKWFWSHRETDISEEMINIVMSVKDRILAANNDDSSWIKERLSYLFK